VNRFDLSVYLRAEVVDIRQPYCSVENKMLIDTNVLYFCYYDRFSQLEALDTGVRFYQTSEYPTFLKKLLSSQSTLFVHKINLLELANTIERAELQILYCKVNEASEIGKDVNLKALRRSYPKEFRIIQRRLVTYLHSIKKAFRLIGPAISIDQLLGNFLIEWQDSLADAGDAMIVAEARREGINSVLSDDAFFATLNNIKFYTANRTAISAYKRKKPNRSTENINDPEE
jgi:predicted nucleic acid-binding protein